MAGKTTRSVRFGSWFYDVRARLKQTQVEAAAALCVPQPAISRWELGGVPGAEHVLPIAKWAGVETDHVLRLIGADAEARR
jgi:transcriptional regulator with XRE-family HTH domain